MIIDIQATVDLAFRMMLGSPKHAAVTIHFLNSILRSGPRIQQVTILDPTLEKETVEDKLSILDIKAQDETGRLFNIEMQTSLTASLHQRLIYYAARLHGSQLPEGAPYSQLCPTICICVLSQSFFAQYPLMHLELQLRDPLGLVSLDELQLHFIQLPKSTTDVHNVQIACSLERWSFLFQRAHEIDADELRRLLPEPEFHEALGVLEMISQTPATRELYEARLKAKRDEESRLYDARMNGLTQGRAEGRVEGRVEGKWIGKIQVLEGLLGLPPTDPTLLESWDAAQLAARSKELEQLLAAAEKWRKV
ncbi:MAG: Rpn family recombination-promoting nuclease/putative transposase [Planctomycetota bacterium]